ncbi:hypothetical protein EJ03DRAFT_376298 [Teratosphaeria nubilosa]|uniref:Uncharacterized protein n=1 Tax=Teratosphaeria nubilosa TaxID=161662 RepID=A0A6G1L319_9PEZI|nr:hypothetical protein EJ03DRAFT_376298 [Teratosphaeria nubilosa]
MAAVVSRARRSRKVAVSKSGPNDQLAAALTTCAPTIGTASAPSTVVPFSRLPPELRVEVYKLVNANEAIIVPCYPPSGDYQQPYTNRIAHVFLKSKEFGKEHGPELESHALSSDDPVLAKVEDFYFEGLMWYIAERIEKGNISPLVEYPDPLAPDFLPAGHDTAAEDVIDEQPNHTTIPISKKPKPYIAVKLIFSAEFKYPGSKHEDIRAAMDWITRTEAKLGGRLRIVWHVGRVENETSVAMQDFRLDLHRWPCLGDELPQFAHMLHALGDRFVVGGSRKKPGTPGAPATIVFESFGFAEDGYQTCDDVGSMRDAVRQARLAAAKYVRQIKMLPEDAKKQKKALEHEIEILMDVVRVQRAVLGLCQPPEAFFTDQEREKTASETSRDADGRFARDHFTSALASTTQMKSELTQPDPLVEGPSPLDGEPYDIFTDAECHEARQQLHLYPDNDAHAKKLMGSK